MKKEYQNPQINISSEEFKKQVENSNITVSSFLLEEIFLLLDGSNTIETVIGTLIIGGHNLENVTEIIKWLSDKEFLSESNLSDYGKLSQEERKYFGKQINLLGSYKPSDNGLLSISKAGMASQVLLKEASVFLIGIGMANDFLISNFIEIGVGNIFVLSSSSDHKSKHSIIHHFDEGDLKELLSKIQPNLLIYCSDNFELDKSIEYNRICLDKNISFLPYKRTYLNVEIGPLVLPNRTACYYCTDCRKKSASLYADKFEKDTLEKSFDHSLNFPIGIEYLTLEALKVISKVYEPSLKNKLLVFDIMSGNSTFYPVFKLPRCKECGIHKLSPRKKLWEI